MRERECVCQSCGEVWFAPLRKKGGPYRTRCESCHKQARKEVYQTQNRKKYAARQEFLRSYKLVQGCVDCGYRDHVGALQFDHVAGVKVKNVAKFADWPGMLRELAKCVVRCANCHAIRSWEVSRGQA